MEKKEDKTEITFRKIGQRLHRFVPILDTAGKVIQFAVSPLKVQLLRRDVMQIILGASILAIPVGFTEETWDLGTFLPLRNVLVLGAISLTFISLYVYFNFYRQLLRQHLFEYLKRVGAIYLLSLLVVGILLTTIQKAPWVENPLIALKRTIIVAFPSAMSAAVSDAID